MSEKGDDYCRIEIACVQQSELDMRCECGPMAGEMSHMKLSIVDRVYTRVMVWLFSMMTIAVQ